MPTPLLLILDLDETLIHARPEPLLRPADFRVAHYHVYRRPYLTEFLTFAAAHFDLAIWSSASPDYVTAIVQALFPDPTLLKFVWARDRCTPRTQYDTEGRPSYSQSGFLSQEYTKPLYKLRRRGYDLTRILIVDDTPSKVANAYGNAIYIPEYLGHPDDELLRLRAYLHTLKNCPNVRVVEKRHWRNTLPG